MVLGGRAPPGYAALVDERAARCRSSTSPVSRTSAGSPSPSGPGSSCRGPRPRCPARAPSTRAGRGWGSPLVVDLCTGSGRSRSPSGTRPEGDRARRRAVRPRARAWAVANRDRLGLDVDLRLGDATTAFDDLVGEVDVVVSNPPYIPLGAVPVDPEVRDHDPEVALYGGSADGLAVPVAVAARAAVLLRGGGVLVMEHADTQGGSLPAALRDRGLGRGRRPPGPLGRARADVAVRASGADRPPVSRVGAAEP